MKGSVLRWFAVPVIAACLLLLSAAPPQPIGYGQTATGQLSAAQPEALYIFTGQAGDVITITMDRVDGLIDPLLVLIDESQTNVLAVDNDSGGDHNARLRFVIPADGRYVIKATGAQGSDLNGSYRLTLTLGNPTPTPSPHLDLPRLALLTSSGALQADLDEHTRFRLYVINLKKGDPLSATLTTASSLQAGLFLYSDDFHELARAELGSALNFSAPTDGLYILLVGRASGSGSYTLNATLPTSASLPVPHAVSMIPGEAQPGSLDNAVGTLFTFEAQPGLSVDVTLNGPDAVLILADSAFKELASSANGQIRGVMLPQPGKYLILVLRSGGPNDPTTGAFTLTIRGTLAQTPAPTSGAATVTAIAYGRTVNDALTNSRPLVFYTFQGSKGDVVTIQMAHLSGNNLDPLLYLYSYANGNPILLGGDDNRAPGDVDAAILDFTLPENGIYLIAATRSGGTIGSFILSLSRRAS